MKRDTSIDTLRGIAIFTMVAANMAAEVLAAPHPFLFRFYGTFAAPTFICLSGMMVAYTTRMKNYTLGYFLARGALTVLTGALIDTLGNGVFPFLTMEVLYLIGYTLPLAFLFLRLGPIPRWILVLAIFAVTPLLQRLLGYSPEVFEIQIFRATAWPDVPRTSQAAHWLVDGWFPIFPWVGFSLLGANLGLLRRESTRAFGGWGALATGLGVLTAGAVVFALFPGALYIRDGYSEMFYPPTIGFCLCAAGVILTLLALLDRAPGSACHQPFRLLGESALFLYMLHLALINYLLAPLFPEQPFSVFALLYLAAIGLLLLTGFGLRWLKNRWPRQPFLVRFLLGG